MRLQLDNLNESQIQVSVSVMLKYVITMYIMQNVTKLVEKIKKVKQIAVPLNTTFQNYMVYISGVQLVDRNHNPFQLSTS